jgi:hypothetical protein
MGAYDSLIQVPVPGQAISVSQYGVPVRDAILDIDDRLEEATYELPNEQTGYGAGANTIVSGANVWADLPTFPSAGSITNPHPSREMLCTVTYGAWLGATTGGVRIFPVFSGAVTLAGGSLGTGNGPEGWGEVPLSSLLAGTESGFAASTVTVPAAGVLNFKIQALRSIASGTQQVNYATIRVNPLRYK